MLRRIASYITLLANLYAWKEIFGIYFNKIDLLEPIRCFKCDTQGPALICRIRLKDNNMRIKELQGKGLMTRVEVLYREKDGSFVVFIEGKSCVPPSPKNIDSKLWLYS